MSMPQNGAAARPDPREAARRAFLDVVGGAAKAYAAASPISVPAADMARAIDRVKLAFRALANKTPDFYDCSPDSVGRAVALCALTGLMPGGAVPEVDIFPRRINGRLELQWQVGWRGYKTLAARAGCLAKPVNVYAADAFEWEEGLDARLVHRPVAGGERMITDVGTLDPLVAVYVVATYPDGRRDFIVMGRDAVLKRRDRSDGWKAFTAGKIKSTPWADWSDEMVLKTAMRYAAQRGLLLLDDVARYAFDVDGAEERGEIVDTTATPMRAPAPAPRAIADTLGGLDSLADELEREPVPLRETIDEVVEQAAPSAATKKPPAKGKPAAQLTAEQVQLVAAVKAAEDLLAEDKAADVRMSVDVKYNAAVEDLTVDQLRRLADALGVGFGS
jgi:phage RecT family recombinase